MKSIFHKIKPLITRFVPYLDAPIIRIAVFLFLLGYIVERSFFEINNHIRTFESFLILGIGLALIFRGRDHWGNWAGFIVILLLTQAPMYWRMHGFDRDGFSLLGVLPGSDANGYFTGALKLLYGEDIPPFAARRPLFVAFLATILALTGQNLVLSLMILAFVASLSIWMLAFEIRKSLGVIPAALTTVIMIYCYAGRFAGKFLTEQLGIPLGMLALTSFLQGIRRDNFKYLVWGVFILTVALNARAGAMFVLPVLVLWGLTWFGRDGLSVRNFFILCGVVALGFLINYGIFRFTSSPESIPFANFGSTLYGIVTGHRGWRVWYQEYPGAPDAEAFRISFEILRSSPELFMTGIFRAYQEFLNPRYFFSFLYLPTAQQRLASYFLLVLTGTGLWRLVKNIHMRYAQLLLCVLAGILLSVPFAPPSDDAIRAMTATTSFLALLTGSTFINFQNMTQTELQDSSKRMDWDIATYFSGGLILLIVVGWLAIKGILDTPQLGINCDPQEQSVIMSVTPFSYVNILKNNQQSTSLLPDLRRVDVQENLSDFPSGGLWKILRQVESEQTVMLGLNFADKRPNAGLIWLVVATDSVQSYHGLNYFCARQVNTIPLENGDVLVASNVKNVFKFP